MAAAGRDLRDARQRARPGAVLDHDRQRTIRDRIVAEFTIRVITPTPRGSVGQPRTREEIADGELSNVLERTGARAVSHEGWQFRIFICSVANAAEIVTPPAARRS